MAPPQERRLETMSDLQSVRLAALRREYHAAVAAARNCEDVGDAPGQAFWEARAAVLLRNLAEAKPPVTKPVAKR